MDDDSRQQPAPAGDQGARYYIVELWGGTTPDKQAGPFTTEDEYAAAARRMHRELDEDSILLLATVTAEGFELSSFTTGFFEEEAEGDEVET